MTKRHKRQRNVRLIIGIAITAIALVASTAGFMARAANRPPEKAPENVERLVTDLSKYVMLHQTRNASRLLIMTPASAPCEFTIKHQTTTTAKSI